MSNFPNQLFRVIKVDKRTRHNIWRLHQMSSLFVKSEHNHKNPFSRNMNPVFHHRLMHRFVRIIIQLVTHRDSPTFFNRLVRQKLNNVPIIRQNNPLARNPHYILRHLSVMLKHIEFPVIWHVVLRLKSSHKLHMVFIVSMPRKVQRPNISQVRLAILNHLCPFA